MNEELTAEESALDAAMQAEAPVESTEQDAPESAQQAEQPAEQDAAPEDGEKVKMVPHGAMHKERERAKSAEAANAELQAQLEALQAQMAETAETVKQIKNPVEPPKTLDQQIAELPDQIDDPDGFKAALAALLKPQAEQVGQVQQQIQEQRQRQAVEQHVAQVEQVFREQAPDYDDALNFAMDARRQELKIWGVPEHQIEAAIHNEVAGIINNSIATGLNHAQQVYDYAKLRGYQGPKPAATEADRMGKLAATQQSQQSLSAAAGSPSGQYDIATLASMSEAELAKVPEAEIARAMGG